MVAVGGREVGRGALAARKVTRGVVVDTPIKRPPPVAAADSVRGA